MKALGYHDAMTPITAPRRFVAAALSL